MTLKIPLETKRLRLELPDPNSPQDLRDHLAFLSQERVVRNLATVPHPYDPTDLPPRYATWIEAYEQDQDDQVFIIRLQETGQLIGSMGLHLQHERSQLEPGYVICPNVWGQGYATEALATFLPACLAAYRRVRRVVSYHYTDNPASGWVMAKVGMVPDGEVMQACLARGPGTYPAKVFVLPDDSPLWPKSR